MLEQVNDWWYLFCWLCHDWSHRAAAGGHRDLGQSQLTWTLVGEGDSWGFIESDQVSLSLRKQMVDFLAFTEWCFCLKVSLLQHCVQASYSKSATASSRHSESKLLSPQLSPSLSLCHFLAALTDNTAKVLGAFCWRISGPSVSKCPVLLCVQKCPCLNRGASRKGSYWLFQSMRCISCSFLLTWGWVCAIWDELFRSRKEWNNSGVFQRVISLY